MKTYNECLEILKSVVAQNSQGASSYLGDEWVDLENAVGRVLRQDVVATEASPPFDNSAMDGFAVNFENLQQLFQKHNSAQPVTLKISQCIAAGDSASTSSLHDAAIEIMTGAPMPNSFYDTVIKIEDVHVIRDSSVISGKYAKALEIKIFQLPQKNENTRKAGEDFQVGQKLLSKGTQLELQHLLGLATLGIHHVLVAKNPVIAIASTGKELVDYHTEKLEPGQIRNSTGMYLQSYFKNNHLDVQNLGIIDDCMLSYQQTLLQAFDNGAEIFISTGAVSMGQFDFVKPALLDLGATIHFHKAAIRPGKPILFASLNYKQRVRFIFGVPGNPVSTAVGLKFFILPFIENLLDCRSSSNPSKKMWMELAQDVAKPEGLRCFFKASMLEDSGQLKVQSLPGQASFMVSPLLKTNAWVVLPEENKMIPQGTKVEVYAL